TKAERSCPHGTPSGAVPGPLGLLDLRTTIVAEPPMPDETKEPDSPTATEEPTAAATPDAAAAPAEGAEEAPAKLHQTVEVKDVGPCKKHIKVTIDRGDIEQRFDEKFSDLVTEERSFVQGFRPGKAPRKLVERFYKQEVHQQVKAEVLMASLEQLAEEQDIAPLAPPD